MFQILRRVIMTSAGPTAARSNDKKKGSKLVFGSDGTRVLDRGKQHFSNFSGSQRLTTAIFSFLNSILTFHIPCRCVEKV